MNRKQWERHLEAAYQKPGFLSVPRIIEKQSGKRFGLQNNEAEFTHKGLKYRLEHWVVTTLTVIWSNGDETTEFESIWLPGIVKWFCVMYIINFHPNRKR